MAGKGPPPKSAATRQRRNKTTTSARLETDEQPREEAPPLGEHPEGGEWHPRTVAWWNEVWSSPMAEEYLRADEDGLYMLATLVDAFWKEPSVKAHQEIRLARQPYGITPIDRRRLQWEIGRAEQAERKRPSKLPAPTYDGGDPRSALKAI
jgi:hypothetical protein